MLRASIIQALIFVSTEIDTVNIVFGLALNGKNGNLPPHVGPTSSINIMYKGVIGTSQTVH